MPENSVCTILTEDLQNTYFYDPELQKDILMTELIQDFEESSPYRQDEEIEN